MKKQLLSTALIFLFLSMFSSCAVVGGIFKAGVGVGVFISVLVVVLIIVGIVKMSGK